MTIWVINTSPLIFLSHLERLNLLRSEGREVFIPRAVLDEVVAREDRASAAVRLACKTWLKIKDVADRTGLDLIRAAIRGPGRNQDRRDAGYSSGSKTQRSDTVCSSGDSAITNRWIPRESSFGCSRPEASRGAGLEIYAV